MTPKDMADEMIHSFRSVHPSRNYTGFCDTMAKQCALIAVDKIINSNPQKPVFKTEIDIHGQKEYLHDYPTDLFWEEVRSEIIKPSSTDE